MRTSNSGSTLRAVNRSPDPDEPPAVTAGRMVNGHWLAQAIFVAVELRIPDLLAEGPASSDDLATATETDASALHRLLRALASHAVVRQLDDGRFGRTELSDQFRRDVPGTLGPYARYIIGNESNTAWGSLLHSVRTGQTAFDHVFGSGLFEYFGQHPESERVFNEAMSSSSQSQADGIVGAYDFSGFGTVVDVAGGQGRLLSVILKRNPGVRGVLFDLTSALEEAPQVLEREGVADRCRLVPGDFFRAVPEGGDAYVLKSIIHDWDDERSIAILANCRVAMSPSARLLLIERVRPERIDETNAVQRATLMDLNMLILTGGQERTRSEFEALFDRAGFVLERSVPTPSGFQVVEGRPR